MSSEAKSQFQSFLQREIPDRIVRQLNHSVRDIPALQPMLQIPERTLSEVMDKIVRDAFDAILPSVPQAVPSKSSNDRSVAIEGYSKVLPHRSSPQIPIPETSQGGHFVEPEHARLDDPRENQSIPDQTLQNSEEREEVFDTLTGPEETLHSHEPLESNGEIGSANSLSFDLSSWIENQEFDLTLM